MNKYQTFMENASTALTAAAALLGLAAQGRGKPAYEKPAEGAGSRPTADKLLGRAYRELLLPSETTF